MTRNLGQAREAVETFRRSLQGATACRSWCAILMM